MEWLTFLVSSLHHTSVAAQEAMEHLLDEFDAFINPPFCVT